MENFQNLSIVVPVYNEKASIRQLFSEITTVCRTNNYNYEIIIIDDGSTDGTSDTLLDLSPSDPHLKHLRLSRNFGQTAALAAGLDAATGECILTMDGDLQNDPADIPRLLKKLEEGYDLVNGWRKNRKDPFLFVQLPSMIANVLIQKITSVKIHDTGCTLKAFRREILKDLHLYGEMHRFIPALLHWIGARIGEVEVNHRPRKQGRSKYGFSKLPRVVLDMLNVKFLISYSTRPIQIFGKMAFYTAFMSLVSFAGLVYTKLEMGINMTGNPLLLLTVFLGFLAVQFLMTGFLGEINIRTYHEATNRKIYRVEGLSGISAQHESLADKLEA